MTISPLVIFFASIFTSSMIFSNFLGICSFIAVSKGIGTATGLGIAVTFVLTITTIINFFLCKLVARFDIGYLRYIVFIISIAAFVQLLEMTLEECIPNLYYALRIFLLLITVSYATLGIDLFIVIRNYSFLQTIGFAIGSGLGWILTTVSMTGIRSKIKDTPVPAGLRESPLTLVIAEIMAMASIGFSGIVRIS